MRAFSYRARMVRTFAALPLLLLASCSGDGGNPQIEVNDAWVRPTVGGGQMSAGYATITNTGGRDRLVSVESDAAERITLHSSTNVDGVARMRPLTNGLVIERGASAQLAPGGNHMMLEAVSRPLAPGQSIRLTLHFARSGDKVVTAAVRAEPAVPEHMGH